MKMGILVLSASLLLLSGSNVLAHPGSGIVVDRQGNVYFVDTGSGVWKIDKAGKLTKLDGPAYHWMAIDLDDRLAKVQLPRFLQDNATIARVGHSPTLLLSSDFPVTVGTDGSLYYPWLHGADEVQIFRLTPSGVSSVAKSLPPARSPNGEARWRNGIAATADGSIYYSEDRAVRRVTPKGEVVTIAADITVPGCESTVGVEPELGPYCRGLDVDSAGTVYVAATGCGAVLKITPDKKISTILKTKNPWSPTSVAVSGGDVYVLEYLHTAGDNRREWLPRVRKISANGEVTTLATIERK